MDNELLNGIVGDYYYIDGVLQKTGLTLVDGYFYYFSTTNGAMRKSVTQTVNHKAEGVLLPTGVPYTFDAKGRVVDEFGNPITEEYTTGQLVDVLHTQVTIQRQLANDVHILLVLTILTFAMGCFRAWRSNVIKGGK